MKYYAGIGSRKTPDDILNKMVDIADDLEKRGYTLRSGGAIGADQAFEFGIDKDENTEVLRPDDATEEAIELASLHHPAWDKCTEYAKKLHGRNVMIIMGPDLMKSVEFVVCWSPNEEYGGTALGIRIARKFDIPIYNLAKTEFTHFQDLHQKDQDHQPDQTPPKKSP